MPELCCCGNEIAKHPEKFTVRRSPCLCEKPGRGPKRIPYGIPETVTRVQYEERKRHGLPLETPSERKLRGR